MASARRLFRLNLALAAVAIATVVAATVIAATHVSPALPSTDAIIAACQRMVPLDPGLSVLLVLGLASIGLLVAGLAARSLVRQLAEQRRFLSALGPVEVVEVDGRSVQVVAGEQAAAFCAGLLRPRIYASEGARRQLSAAELSAVVAHEAHHQRNRDPLRILVIRLLADSFFFLPALRRVSERYRQLAELAADEAAAGARGRPALASALLRFGERGGEAAPVVGIAPERVDHLLGKSPRWQVSASILAGTLVILAALLALVLSAPALIGSQTVSLAGVMAESCMVAMIGIPLAVAIGALYLSGSRLRRRSPANP